MTAFVLFPLPFLHVSLCAAGVWLLRWWYSVAKVFCLRAWVWRAVALFSLLFPLVSLRAGSMAHASGALNYAYDSVAVSARRRSVGGL